MAINSSYISSQPIETNQEVVIEMLPERPSSNYVISPPKTPGQICGWYDYTTNAVYMYVVDATGIRYLRAG